MLCEAVIPPVRVIGFPCNVYAPLKVSDFGRRLGKSLVLVPSLKTRSSPLAGTPLGDQLPAVLQLLLRRRGFHVFVAGRAVKVENTQMAAVRMVNPAPRPRLFFRLYRLDFMSKTRLRTAVLQKKSVRCFKWDRKPCPLHWSASDYKAAALLELPHALRALN